MKNLIYQLEDYIWDNVGIRVSPIKWEKSRELPQYLRALYRFYTMDLLGTECLLIVDTEEEEQSPADVRKHVNQLQDRGQFEVVYVRNAITSYNRKRLIEHKIPFIVPGNQMYLPMLMIDLRKHLKQIRLKKQVFSPSTQTLILYVLWAKKTETLTPAETADRLRYSAMTMTRAFDELEYADVGKYFTQWKERHLKFPETGRSLWEKVLPYLVNPVRKRLYADAVWLHNEAPLAGESALARYSMLAEPKIPVVAIEANEWNRRKQEANINILNFAEPRSVEIELWKYPPTLFAHQGTVDRLSLYLSMKDSNDERIQAALETLMGEMEW